MAARARMVPPSRQAHVKAPLGLRLPRDGRPAFDTAMQQLEEADAANVKQQAQPPVFHGVALIAADGSTWMITVMPSGALQTERVSRT